MLIKNTNITELTEALVRVNEKYEGNVRFNDIKPINQADTRFKMTLRVVSSKGPGHKLSQRAWKDKQRRLVAACWHVHGDYFDCLFDINPKVEIRTGGFIYKSKRDNWEDIQVGSMMFPAYMSDLCECGNEEDFGRLIKKNLQEAEVKTINQKDLSALGNRKV